MKLNNTIKFKNKITKLKIIETKIYQKNLKTPLKLSDITSKLKKSLHIIYKYHVSNKRILFIGTNLLLKQKLENLTNSQHLFLPNSIWLNGILTNQQSCLRYLFKNNIYINNKFSETLYQLKKKVDLIVLLDSNFKNNILSESYLTNTPIIFLGCDKKIAKLKINYNIPGNFKFLRKKLRSEFFSLMLLSTLKKANKKN